MIQHVQLHVALVQVVQIHVLVDVQIVQVVGLHVIHSVAHVVLNVVQHVHQYVAGNVVIVQDAQVVQDVLELVRQAV